MGTIFLHDQCPVLFTIRHEGILFHPRFESQVEILLVEAVWVLIGVGGIDDGSTDMCCGDAEARLWEVVGWLGRLLLVSHRKSISSSVQTLSACTGARKCCSPLLLGPSPEGGSTVGCGCCCCSHSRRSISAWFCLISSKHSVRSPSTSVSVTKGYKSMAR